MQLNSFQFKLNSLNLLDNYCGISAPNQICQYNLIERSKIKENLGIFSCLRRYQNKIVENRKVMENKKNEHKTSVLLVDETIPLIFSFTWVL